MRISKSLIRAGVSEGWQLTICGTLFRDGKGKTTATEHEKILRLCDDIGGSDSDALYRFLTDRNINHDYIRIFYGVTKNRLFAMKKEFYKRWLD